MEHRQLERVIGPGGAVFMGLGAIVGTGVFVSLGIAAGIAGPAVLLAIFIAAGVALCNGLSSAQLAAAYPVSGGTYEYGCRLLHPFAGFLAGWMFLCAKSASAATAALGFAGYLGGAAGLSTGVWGLPLALAAIGGVTGIALAGMRRGNVMNIVIIGVTLLALGAFILAGLPVALRGGAAHFQPFFQDGGGGPLANTLHASALMFVAYTGYGRIATLGEEVRAPERTIPRAIAITLAISAALYALVAFAAIGIAGAPAYHAYAVDGAAPLRAIALDLGVPGLGAVLAIGAVTAMLGVLLNLLLGLSRVALAMGRRGHLPRTLARVGVHNGTPVPAVLAVAALIALLACSGDVRLTWSFSAFTVLVYYALTNLCALRLPAEKRRFPRGIAGAGLAACLLLAAWVEPAAWIAGLGMLAAGALWFGVAEALRRRAAA